MLGVNVKLDAFEGPLDLLYHLIEKNEIDIYDIPIAKITSQYLEYLNGFQEKSMENMSEFLVMAATLIEIKSKMLLPKIKNDEKDEDDDPRDELVQKLLEYKRFKDVTEKLKKKEEEGFLVFFKGCDESLSEIKKEDTKIEIEKVLQGISSEDIYKAFEDVMKRKDFKVDKIRSGFNSVARDTYTIGEKMDYIKDLITLHKKVDFKEIFRGDSRKIEVVVTFLALLELMKLREVCIFQDGLFKRIIITKFDGSD